LWPDDGAFRILIGKMTSRSATLPSRLSRQRAQFGSGGDGIAHRRPDAARDRVARILVEAARAAPLLAVADAEPLQRVARDGHRRPAEVLEAGVVRHADVLAELPLGEAHERAVHRLRAQRLGAEPRAD